MRRPSTVILLLLLSAAACLAQSGTNYISRRTYFRPDVSYQDVTYYDGLGYTAAEVQVGLLRISPRICSSVDSYIINVSELIYNHYICSIIYQYRHYG